jgi:Domain of Unknown Function (DUF928)
MKNFLPTRQLFSCLQKLQQAPLFYFPTILSIIVGLITSSIIIFFHPDISTSKQLIKKTFHVPHSPHGRGIPRNRKVSGSMGGLTCKLTLVALAPEFQTPQKDVWGETTTQFPTLWFSINASVPSKTKLEFSLQDENDKDSILTATIETPQQPGIIGIKNSKQPLELNKTYHWTLKTTEFCDNGKEEPPKYVAGFITMVKENNDGGIWYDNVTNIAQQLLSKPDDVLLKKQWKSLLKDIDLEETAEQPLISIVEAK